MKTKFIFFLVIILVHQSCALANDYLRVTLSADPVQNGDPVVVTLTEENTGNSNIYLFKLQTPFSEMGVTNEYFHIVDLGTDVVLERKGIFFEPGRPTIDDYIVIAPSEQIEAEVELGARDYCLRNGEYSITYTQLQTVNPLISVAKPQFIKTSSNTVTVTTTHTYCMPNIENNEPRIVPNVIQQNPTGYFEWQTFDAFSRAVPSNSLVQVEGEFSGG